MADEKKYNEAEFAVGVEIEHEHQPTYNMIKKVLEETGKLPEAIEVFKSITKDHLNEFGNYYNDEVGLPNMERELKKTKPEEVKGGNTMERMNLEINGSIFNGMTDGKHFYFNAIDRAEMGESVELAKPEPIDDKKILDEFYAWANDPWEIGDGEGLGVHTRSEAIGGIRPITFALCVETNYPELKDKAYEMFGKVGVDYYPPKVDAKIKAEEVVDAFPGSGEGSGSGSGSGSGDAVIVEPVIEEIGEIKEEKVEVEILKDIKQDLKDAEKGIDEMIKHEGGEVAEELGEIAPELGPIDPLAEPMAEGMPEPMLAKKEKKRKFEVDPTEIGKKDLVKGAKGNAKERLEYLRKQIENENISYEEIAELQDLAEYIDPDDVLLLEWAGVEEFGDFRKGLRDKKDKGSKKAK